MRIFEFAAMYIPKKADELPKIIIKPTTVLAKDEKQAAMLAAREIPVEYVSKLDQVDIAVRPF